MEQTAAFEVLLVCLILLGVVFGWDGLVRRHIRVDIDGLDMHLRLRGFPAILAGAGCITVAFVVGRVAVEVLWPVAAACRSVPCLVQTLVIPVLTIWQTAVGLLVPVLLFALWLPRAGDLHGPYHRRPLAPGVWEDEKEMVTLVCGRLLAAHLARVTDDTIEDMASWVERNIALLTLFARRAVTRDGRYDAEALVEHLVLIGAGKRFGLAEPTLRVVLAAIVDYRLDLLNRVARAYSWLRRMLRRRRQGTMGR